MSQPIIKAEGLGKKYVIDHQPEGESRYQSLRDTLMNGMRAVGRHFARSPQRMEWKKREEFWALRDVNFEIQPGEVVGIIGRNGAGKSTLLKILSRITEPTTGEVVLHGRVASLLEVGTGFHPELTGRENVFLNGTILGMSRAEIRKKFDEIVAFAEVEKFLDTPVKRYSSGMYMRLAFAVAAHLEPEILIVDEVLAVGDSEFQKKCLGKMDEVAWGGRTVIFVSHQLAMIESLCQRGVILEKGRIAYQGTAAAAAAEYIKRRRTATPEAGLTSLRRIGSGQILLTNYWLENDRCEVIDSVSSGGAITLAFEYTSTARSSGQVSFGFSITTANEIPLAILYSDYQGATFSGLPRRGVIRFHIPRLALSLGTYYVGARVLLNGVEADWPQEFIGKIQVESGDFYGAGLPFHSGIGPVLLDGRWSASSTTTEG